MGLRSPTTARIAALEDEFLGKSKEHRKRTAYTDMFSDLGPRQDPCGHNVLPGVRSEWPPVVPRHESRQYCHWSIFPRSVKNDSGFFPRGNLAGTPRSPSPALRFQYRAVYFLASKSRARMCSMDRTRRDWCHVREIVFEKGLYTCDNLHWGDSSETGFRSYRELTSTGIARLCSLSSFRSSLHAMESSTRGKGYRAERTRTAEGCSFRSGLSEVIFHDRTKVA